MRGRLLSLVIGALIGACLLPAAQAAGPSITTLPAISGNLVVGQVLTVAPGTWDSTPSSVLFQWFKCSSDLSSSCSGISGATGSTYLIASSDINFRFQVSVTALTAGGGTTVVSPLTGLVLTLASASALPVVSGESTKGSTLSTTTGAWNVNVLYFTYQWQRCTTSELASCTTLSGAASSSYVTLSEDVGKFVRAIVTAPAAGTYSSGSASTILFGPISSVPQQTGSASVSGAFFENETVTAVLSTYVAYPAPTITYQWQRCAGGMLSGCESIVGATNRSYSISPGDVGSSLRFLATVQNNLGGIIVPSAMSTVVSPQSVPVNTELPLMTGYAHVSYSISVTSGVWKGAPAPTYSYQWQSCTVPSGADCVDIKGATLSYYSPVFGDALKLLRARVTATNRVGTSIVYSRLSPSVEPNVALISSPSITGFGIVGLSYTASSAYWNGATKPVATQWQRCGKKDGSDCVDIAGETKTVYLMTQDDEGKFIRIKQWLPDEALPVYSVITGDPIYPKVETPVLAPVVAKPVTAPKPVAKPVVKATTITCVKGTLSKKVKAVSPKCPTGFKKK